MRRLIYRGGATGEPVGPGLVGEYLLGLLTVPHRISLLNGADDHKQPAPDL